MREDDLEISRQMSKQHRDERLAKERGMLRLYTPAEEDILKKGLQESELPTDIGDRMEEDIKYILSNN